MYERISVRVVEFCLMIALSITARIFKQPSYLGDEMVHGGKCKEVQKDDNFKKTKCYEQRIFNGK